MSLQFCTQLIACFQRIRKTPTSTKTVHCASDPDSKSWRYIEQPAGRSFYVLAETMIPAVVKTVLPTSCSANTGWNCRLTPLGSIPLVFRKDGPRKGGPSKETPNPESKPWFLSGEGARISTELDEQNSKEKYLAKKEFQASFPQNADEDADPGMFDSEVSPERGARTITSFMGSVEHLADPGPHQVTSPPKRCDLEAFCRGRLKKLLASKLQHQIAQIAKKLDTADDSAEVMKTLTEAAVWHAKKLSLREIAEQAGRTQAWARWRLAVASKVFISLGIKDLTAR
jgi:hypothetical protein